MDNKTINIGIPTYNNYSGCINLLESLFRGTVQPDNILVIDNGGSFHEWYPNPDYRVKIYVPGRNLGVGLSWNVFITVLPEIRIILNDDLVFYKDTLETFINNLNPDTISYPVGNAQVNAFSFYSLPDKVIDSVGYFDECFYPAYYEDNSYGYRMKLKNLFLYPVEGVNVIHAGSQTLKNYSPEQMNEHHVQFRKNQELYIQMWGGLPGEEKYITPFNK